MTTPSGEPYQYGDDTVAARLEVDIPAEAITSLGEVNKLTADLRANMEAVAKYSQDYSEYLRELPNTLGEVDSATSRMASSGSSIFGGDMTPIADPFTGRNYGDGSSTMSGPGAGRPMRGVDQGTLIELARNNPRQVANMAADRGLDDYFDDDQSYVLPRQEPGPRPGAGREMQFSGGGRPPSAPRSPRSSTGPGDDDGRAAGTGTGRQVTPEGTESQAERAAKRLLAEIEKGDDTRTTGQKIRGFGESAQNSSLINFLNTEGSSKGKKDALGFLGGIGSRVQSSAEGLQQQGERMEEQRQSLLAQAGEVAATNPQLAAQLASRAQGMAGKSAMLGRAMPFLKGAGIAGAVVAGAAGVNKVVQNTGETIQEFRGTGAQMGGGVAEGAAFEAQVRTMAMNPFISTEQSRKIMQSALQTGYTGKEFDTMTEFMAENLKSMNMDVAESTKLLQQNVLKGGQDMTSLQAQLSQNVAMAGQTDLSASQINDQFGRISGGLIDSGAGGAAAGATAQSFTGLFANNPVLKDQGGDILNRLLTSNPTVQSHFAAGAGMTGKGIPLSSTAAWATDNMESGEITEQMVKALGETLRPALALYDSGNTYAARQQAASLLGVNENQAQEILELYVSGEIFSMVRDNEQRLEDTGGGKMNSRVGGQASQLANFFSTNQIKGDFNQVAVWWNQLTGDEEGEQRSRDAQHRADSKARLAEQTGRLPSWTPEVLEQLALEEYGGDLFKTTIVDESGEERKLTQSDISNKSFMEKMQKGDIKVKTEEGGVQTLREWGNSTNTSEAGTGGMTHQIGMNEETRRFFNLTQMPSANQQRADQGRANRNDDESALEGYGIPTRPGR